jgi:quercetin dioxygenase-like cupin family protein
MSCSNTLAVGWLAALVAVPLNVNPAPAQQSAVTTVTPESLTLGPTPVGPGVTGATVVGSPAQGGAIYALYVKYADGARSAPHTHPDQRVVTVISGTFYAGAGPEFDATKVTALKPGSVIVIPAGAVHYGWARDGDVILQEAGLGPSGTTLWPKPAPK